MTEVPTAVDVSRATRSTPTGLKSVQLLLLGTFALRSEGREIKFPTRKAESLLAYLALKRGRATPRKGLAGTLWPDTDDLRASRNLNTTVWRVRTTLGSGGISSFFLQSDQTRVSLRFDSEEVDVAVFHDLVATPPSEPSGEGLQRLIKAEAIYRGDLLEGSDDEWIESERSSIRNQYFGLLRTLVNACGRVGQYDIGLKYARKLVDLDPLDEAGHRALMQQRFMSGNRTGALAHYDLLRALLRSELGVEPSQECTDLWLYIKSDGQSPRQAGTTNDLIAPTKSALHLVLQP